MEKKEDVRKGVPLKWTEEKRTKIGEDLLEFCRQPHVFHFSQWCTEQKKTVAWWYNLISKYDDLIEYHRLAKQILGGKIVQLAFEHGNKWAIQTFIPRYLDDMQRYMDDQDDKKLERAKRLEKYKKEIGSNNNEDSIAKLDAFDKTIELELELNDLKQYTKQLNDLLLKSVAKNHKYEKKMKRNEDAKSK